MEFLFESHYEFKKGGLVCEDHDVKRDVVKMDVDKRMYVEELIQRFTKVGGESVFIILSEECRYIGSDSFQLTGGTFFTKQCQNIPLI